MRREGRGLHRVAIVGARSIGLGLVLLGFLVGALRAASAQTSSQTLQVNVNVPYVVQFGFRVL